MLVKLSKHWRYMLVGPMMMASFLTATLMFRNIPLFASNSFLAYLILTLIGLLLGLMMVFGGVVMQTLTCACFATFLVFYQAVLIPELNLFGVVLHYRFSLLILFFILFFVIRKNLEQFSFITLGVLWLSMFFIPSPENFEVTDYEKSISQPGNLSLPPYIHIILDGHIGIEGYPSFADPTGNFIAEIKNKYIDQGFRVFGRAYSRHNMTVDSIPSTFNFKPQQKNIIVPFDGTEALIIRPNKLFEQLSKQGYIINVVSPKHFIYCEEEASYRLGKCATYQQELTPKEFGAVDILHTVLYQLKIHTHVNKVLQKLELPILVETGSLPVAVVTAIKEQKEFFRGAQKGNAYIMHLYIPHGPYILDEQCSYSNIFNQPVKHLIEPTFQEFIEFSYYHYSKQIKCTHRMVDVLINKINSDPKIQDSIIVIQSDHGSRIIEGVHQVNHNPDREGLIQLYSSFFAIRSPNHVQGYDRSPMALDELMKTVVFNLPRPTHLKTDNSEFVYYTIDKTRVRKRLILPPFSNGHPVDTW